MATYRATCCPTEGSTTACMGRGPVSTSLDSLNSGSICLRKWYRQFLIFDMTKHKSKFIRQTSFDVFCLASNTVCEGLMVGTHPSLPRWRKCRVTMLSTESQSLISTPVTPISNPVITNPHRFLPLPDAVLGCADTRRTSLTSLGEQVWMGVLFSGLWIPNILGGWPKSAELFWTFLEAWSWFYMSTASLAETIQVNLTKHVLGSCEDALFSNTFETTFKNLVRHRKPVSWRHH